MIHIALVDDDPDYHTIYDAHFKNALGIQITHISSYLEAIASFLNNSYDLYIIDYNLHGYSGLELIKLLQKEDSIENRIVLMSERLTKENRIDAFDLGVSNIVDKPVDFDILKALLNKNIRMIEKFEKNTLYFDDFELSTQSYEVKNLKTNELINLTASEFRILMRLILARGSVIPKIELCSSARPDRDPMSFKSLEMKIVGLRKKLFDPQGEKVRTVRGLGYQINPECLKR